MFKSLVRKFAVKFYLLGKAEVEKQQQYSRYDELKQNLIAEDYNLIDRSALIQNSQGDPNKIVIGKKSNIKGHLMLFKHGGEITIGDFCFVGEQTKIWSAKKIVIGNRVLISHNVNIHDNISHPLNFKDRHKDYIHIIEKGFQENVDLREKEIIIEDDVWIGFNCTLFKGVKIGKGAIIGACTIVTENVPPYAVLVGNPPRIIKYVDNPENNPETSNLKNCDNSTI